MIIVNKILSVNKELELVSPETLPRMDVILKIIVNEKYNPDEEISSELIEKIKNEYNNIISRGIQLDDVVVIRDFYEN
jgi:hypothetical protein